MSKTFNYDIVFCQLPPMSVERIYSAPPILKGVVQSLGYKSRCFDFNLKLFEICNRDFELFSKLSNYFILSKTSLSETEQSVLSQFFDEVVETLVESNSRYIGLSVFSYYTHYVTTQLLLRFKQLGISEQIVLGGRGLTNTPCISTLETLEITNNELHLDFFEIVKARGLATHVINGDGEDAIVELLQKGDISASRFETEKLVMHWPDYNDYNFDDYVWVNGVPALDITGSTGCVRNCDFCTVPIQFGKYKFLPGQDLAKQMIHFQQTYKINKFVLTDSLANGGIKHFKEFVSYLVEYNASAETPIIWTGQYICRDMSNSKNVDDFYRLIKLSGAEGLTIGAESGSNNVLEAMDKKSSVEALFFELEKFRQHDISCQLLTFCGHWSEQHQDFVNHCQMLIKLIPYVRSETISSLYLGDLFSLVSGTPAALNINNVFSPKNTNMWISRVNRGNTFKVRAQRRLILSKLMHALDCGALLDETHCLIKIISNLENYADEFDQFFTKYTSDDSQFSPISDADAFVSQMLLHKESMQIKFKVEANSCNGDPHVVIQVNNIVLWDGVIVSGLTDFEFVVEKTNLKNHNNVINICMTNKSANDTTVDSHGNIIADKNIIFREFLIDNCDLLNDTEFCYNKLGSQGLWSNIPVTLNFDLPFVQWYSRNSNKNKINSLVEISKDRTHSLYDVEESFKILTNHINKLAI